VSEPKIQRWECETNEFGDSDMQKNIIGNYVRYEDYARLKAEVEMLTADLKRLANAGDIMRDEIANHLVYNKGLKVMNDWQSAKEQQP
jgi:hypothetical protein